VSEDPIFKKEIVWAQVFPELERYIKAVPDAKAALAMLVEAGCKRKRILRYLYWFIGGRHITSRRIRDEKHPEHAGNNQTDSDDGYLPSRIYLLKHRMTLQQFSFSDATS